MTLHVPRHNRGRASIGRIEADSEPLAVRQRDAGALLGSLGLGPVRLLKLDVEGYEADVVAGAEAWLRAQPPDAILFELNDYEGDATDQPVVRQLARLGHRFAEAPKRLVRMGLRAVPDGTPGRLANDLLAVRPGAAGDAILAAVRAR